MNKKFVYQAGNNKKVILWCTANQVSNQLQSWALYHNMKRPVIPLKIR